MMPRTHPTTVEPWKIALAAAAGVALAHVVHELTRTKRQKHDDQVRRIVAATERDGWLVAADIAGYPKPPSVFGHRADVHAWHPDGRERLVEVEHEDTLDSVHTRRQCAAFVRYEGLRRRREFLLATT
jgi:hypothetical protein